MRAPAAAAAVGAGPLRDLPAPGALAARPRAHELPERRAHDLPDAARAAAFLAGQHVRPGRGAIALADLAGAHELEVQVDVHAGAASARSMSTAACASAPASGPVAPGESAAEERAEQVVQEREIHEALGVEALPRDRLVPVAVVARAPVVVGEHLVGLGDLAETLLGVRLPGDVRVQLPGQATEGLLDLAIGCVAAHAEQLVVVLLRHRFQDSTFSSILHPRLEGENATSRARPATCGSDP